MHTSKVKEIYKGDGVKTVTFSDTSELITASKVECAVHYEALQNPETGMYGPWVEKDHITIKIEGSSTVIKIEHISDLITVLTMAKDELADPGWTEMIDESDDDFL